MLLIGDGGVGAERVGGVEVGTMEELSKTNGERTVVAVKNWCEF